MIQGAFYEKGKAQDNRQRGQEEPVFLPEGKEQEGNGQKKDIQAIGTHQNEKKAKEAQLDKQRKAFRQGGFGEMFPFVFQVQELI